MENCDCEKCQRQKSQSCSKKRLKKQVQCLKFNYLSPQANFLFLLFIKLPLFLPVNLFLIDNVSSFGGLRKVISIGKFTLLIMLQISLWLLPNTGMPFTETMCAPIFTPFLAALSSILLTFAFVCSLSWTTVKPRGFEWKMIVSSNPRSINWIFTGHSEFFKRFSTFLWLLGKTIEPLTL